LPAPFDEVWRRAALRGDGEAASLLAREMVGPLFSFCFYRVGKRRDLCEEVVQETMVMAMRTLAAYEPKRSGGRGAGSMFGWLTGLARNEIQRVLRRERGTVSLDELWARMDRELLDVFARVESEAFSEELLRREETVEMVNATMSQLPPHYRECLEKKYVEGKSVREMAGGMGVSEKKAVESLLTRAREAFRGTFTALARSLGVEGIRGIDGVVP
jgi:RNA polymerase sigma factor (sigma-70 family)